MTPSGDGFENPPFEARQYLLTLVLLGLGAWCVRDGWFNSDPELQPYLWFNRVAGVVLLVWGSWDGWRMRRREIAHARRRFDAERARSQPQG